MVTALVHPANRECLPAVRSRRKRIVMIVEKPAEANERISAHSSDDATSVPFDDSYVPSASYVEEQLRLEKKIEKIRRKITKNSIEREADIEQYLRAMNSAEAETAQVARLRQNFERKNKKYSQEAEQLQRKLEDCEQRLHELESNGVEALRPAHPRRAGLKEMAGGIISAPLDIAKSVKKNVFGSTDNLPTGSTEEDNKNTSGVGKSIFYADNTDYGSPAKREDETRTETTEEKPSVTETESTHRQSRQFSEDSDQHVKKLLQELLAVKKENNELRRNYEVLKKETENVVRIQSEQIHTANYKITNLERILNEQMELQQNEVKQLKNDLNLIGTRMDYQYNDRFKKIEESVEGAQNRLYRIETSWHENTEKLLSTGQNMWNSVMLSFANIVVEVLKIILYFIAVILDTVKPLTGTRRRAGFVVTALVVFFALWSILGIGQLIGDLFDFSSDAAKNSNRADASA